MLLHRLLPTSLFLLSTSLATIAHSQPFETDSQLAPPPPPPEYGPPVGLTSLAPFRPQFGLGINASGAWSAGDFLSYGEGGIGFELLLRAHRRLSVEVAAQYLHGGSENSSAIAYARTDVPLLAGLRVHLGPTDWLVSPYLVGVLGADYAQATALAGAGSTWFFEWQGGLGLEGRVGRHFALDVDLRAFERVRSQTNATFVSDSNGNSVLLLGTDYGAQFHVGCGVLF